MTMRRTVMLAAVIAAVGLLLAGLPVAETAPTAQAQTVQHQTEWHVNGDPLLYHRGNLVRLDSLNRNWNNSVNWGRLQDGGRGSDSYYTYANWGGPVENHAEWRMGSRIGTQQISVYIPGTDSVRSTATVEYIVAIAGNPVQVLSVTVNQKTANQPNHKGWVDLLNPSTGEIGWITNGPVEITVRDNEARPSYREDYLNSRIGIVAVRMRCINNCTGTPPPTTTPRTSTAPRISGLQGSMGIVNSSEGGGPGSDRFQVSPSSATATASEGYRYLRAWVEGSGGSRTLKVTTDRRADPGKYTVTVTVTDGSTSTTQNVSVTVVDQKFRIIREGFWRDQRIVALRSFRTIDDEWVRRGDRGGIVAGEDNLSHFGRSWIAEGAKVWDTKVRVSGNALVKGSVSLRGEAKVYGNAQVFGRNIQVSGKAKVYGNARVFSFGHRTQVFGDAAEVYGNAQVYSNAKVSGSAKVYGNARVYGNTATALVYGNAKVYDNAKVRNGARVSGTARICDDADVSGRARVYGNAQVSGPSTLSSGNHGDGARYGNGC